MGTQLEKKFTWVIENFSGLKAKMYSDQFVLGGCKWRLLAYPKVNGVDDLSLYLEVVESNSLPSGWRRDAEFRFRVVNQLSEQSSKSLGTRQWFDAGACSWGYKSMMSFTELHCKDYGYLLNNKLIVEVEVDVLEVIGKLDISDKSEKAAEPPRNTEGPLVAKAPAIGAQGHSLCQKEQKTVDASIEDSDVETHEEESDADASEEDLDDDASEEDLDHDALPAVSKDGVGDISSLNPSEPLKKASEAVTNGVAECNNVSSMAKASNNLLKETQLEKETVDVNGFQVLSSQVKSVSQIFSRHPNIASDFRPKNQKLRTAYMNVLLALIETLCQPPQELSEDDLRDANNSLADLMDAGLKLDWLKPKLDEVSRKKKTEQTCSVQLQGLGKELQKLMLMVTNLGSQLEKAKAEISATKAPLLFDDIV